MKKGILIAILLLCFIFVVFRESNADIVHLKNGGLIKGIVEEETENSVMVKISGGEVILEKKDIEYIEKGKYELEEKDIKKLQEKPRASKTREDQIRSMFSELIEALKNYDVEKYTSLSYNRSEDETSKIKRYQMKNAYSYIVNNPYTIRFARNRREALLTFKESRNETACPYIVVYTDNGWKVDYKQMWKRIRFGSGNKWYWVDKWNK